MRGIQKIPGISTARSHNNHLVIVNKTITSTTSSGDGEGWFFLQRQSTPDPLVFSSFSQSTSLLFPKYHRYRLKLEKEGLSSFGKINWLH
jgi:hypothetical protein